jgi:thiol-disulfide isomerase/thioredoxin
MTARIALSVLCLSIPFAGANAQTTQETPATTAAPAAAAKEKPAEKPPEMPPDLKAMSEAGKITDPVKKIEALEKVKKDFPGSPSASAADRAILTTLASKMPKETARIRQFANSMYKDATAKDKDAANPKPPAKAEPPAKDAPPAAAKPVRGTIYFSRRASTAASIADILLGEDVLLKDAESWAKKGVTLVTLPMSLAEQREGYTRRKQNLPPEEELVKRYTDLRAARMATLGRIELKLGKTQIAKTHLSEAYGVNSGNVAVAVALGEVAAKEGDDAKAFDYLIGAKLSGRLPEASNTTFESVYKKQHNGSLDGLEAMLDSEYEKRFPNPLHLAAYKPTEKRTDRMVLAEIFTGSGCPPCVAADLAFDAAMSRYTRKDLAVIMFHQHIPAPDPMTNPDTQARAKLYSVHGVPTWEIDGKENGGGGPREATKNRYPLIEKEIEKELESAPEARIKVDASLAGGSVKVAAAVSGVTSESKDLKVQVVLVEKELRYTGENGVRFHPMVVRAMGGEKAEGYPLQGSEGSFDANFDLAAVSSAIKTHLDDYEAKGHRGKSFKFSAKKYEIDRHNLAVVVFVQDEKTKHVLQAAYADLATPAGTRSTNEAQ